MKVKQIIPILLLTLLCSGKTFAAQIVYPKSNDVNINSPVTFFIGNETPDNELFINNEKVKIHPSGGFYHVVKLKPGENTFIIDNKKSPVQTYRITRKQVQQTNNKYTYTAFSTQDVYTTNNDFTPLRNAPDDDGKSRLQNLPKGIPVTVIGKFGNYYKIKLAQDDYAWIDKKYLTKQTGYDNSAAKLLAYTCEETASKIVYYIKLNKKVPYIVSEKRVFDVINDKYEPNANGLDVTLYNIKGYPENKYDLRIEVPNKLFGYKAYINDGNEFIIEIKKPPKADLKKPLQGLTITLDPGHGGSEYGAIGCHNDKEKNINLDIALRAKPLLEKAGAKVILTRSNDTDLDLYDRVKISQKNNTDIFISIHSNALPDSAAESYRSGTSTYYFHPQSAHLARALLNTATKELGTKDDKTHQESFAVIRNTESVSVLLEVAYMINPDDSAKLRTPEFRQKAAEAITHGVERYINELNKQE